MTGSTQPAVPQAFAIQAAENEGMPSRPNSKASLTPVARARRLTGTLTLVPLTQTFGQSTLTEFKVWTDELT